MRTFTLGNSGDVVVSGADFDANEISDAAVVRPSGGSLVWNIGLNPFGSPRRNKRIVFGKSGDRALYARLKPEGPDLIGSFGARGGHGELRLRNLRGKSEKAYRFPKSLTAGSRPRPIPIRQEEGPDLILFVTQDESDTTLFVYTIRGRLTRRVTLKGLGTVVVGEFDSGSPGEEVAYSSSSLFRLFYPQTGETGSLPDKKTGELIGEYRIFQAVAPDPQDTEE